MVFADAASSMLCNLADGTIHGQRLADRFRGAVCGGGLVDVTRVSGHRMVRYGSPDEPGSACLPRLVVDGRTQRGREGVVAEQGTGLGSRKFLLDQGWPVPLRA